MPVYAQDAGSRLSICEATDNKMSHNAKLSHTRAWWHCFLQVLTEREINQAGLAKV